MVDRTRLVQRLENMIIILDSNCSDVFYNKPLCNFCNYNLVLIDPKPRDVVAAIYFGHLISSVLFRTPKIDKSAALVYMRTKISEKINYINLTNT